MSDHGQSGDAEDAAVIASAVRRLGRGFMRKYPPSVAAAAGLGLSWDEFYVRGRGGVLGDVSADAVAAALVFFDPGYVARSWAGNRRSGDPMFTAEHFAAALHRWGRDVVPADAASGLIQLCAPVAEAASSPSLLFTAWQSWPWPADAQALAAHLVFVLREHRGACHVMALEAHEVDPLRALLATNTAATAARFGWSPDALPEPESDDVMRSVESLTDQLADEPFGVLSAGERHDLAVLTHSLVQTLPLPD